MKHTVSVETTWHPTGASCWRGPVRFEQRVNGTPTGMSFTVSRRRYWLIRALVHISRVPGIRRVVDRWRRGMIVEYRWVWHGKRGQA